jgi:HK97 family phage prohead protease
MTLTVREETPRDGIAAVLEGVAVPYGTEIQVSGIREEFASGAFDVADVVGKPLFWRHGEQIGRITHANNTTTGLTVAADIADTTLGRDVATLTRLGGMGLSVGFEPVSNAWTATRDKVTRIKAVLRELSATPSPAYATAGVSAIREEEAAMPEAEVVETPVSAPDPRVDALQADVTTMRELLAAVNVSGSGPVSPYAQYRSLGEYSIAAFNGEVSNRAAPDQITSDNPGVMAPNWMTDVKNIVAFGRPAINAVGVQSAGSTGLDFAWPYFDGDLSQIVEAQAGGVEKAALNTVLISLKKGTASLVTYGAYSDISYQLLQRSQPSYLEAHNRIMLASYATITDNVFADALLAGGTASAVDYDLAGDTTGAKFRAAVFVASTEVESATGSPATVVLVASDVFGKLGGWDLFVPAPYGTQNVPGTATASTLSVSVSGLPVVHDRNLAAGSIILTNSSAASWIEDGPFFATAETPSKLGRDVAVYGFGGTAIFNAAGVVKLTNLI